MEKSTPKRAFFLARPKGFEPPIFRIGICCVIQLRHGRIFTCINRREGIRILAAARSLAVLNVHRTFIHSRSSPSFRTGILRSQLRHGR
mgnify:CR=1 FL=1